MIKKNFGLILGIMNIGVHQTFGHLLDLPHELLLTIGEHFSHDLHECASDYIAFMCTSKKILSCMQKNIKQKEVLGLAKEIKHARKDASNDYMIKRLFGSSREIDNKDGNSQTAFYRACKLGYVHIAESLLAKGAQKNLFCEGNYTPLFIAISRNQFAIVKMLLKHKVNANLGCLFHENPLNLAVKKNNYQLVLQLLEHGAEIQPNCGGLTPLFTAIKSSSVEILKLLLTRAFPINYQEPSHKHTLLHDVAFYGNIQKAKLLLSYGANPNIKNKNGDTPIDIARKKRAFSMYTLFLNYQRTIERKPC